MRRMYLVLIALGIVAFLALSAILARVYSADNAERSALTGLVQAEARGDTAAVIARIEHCRQSPACTARAAEVSSALRHSGAVQVLQIQASTGFNVVSTTGTARVAWDVGGSLPIVQCVVVHRAGNAVSGLRVELMKVSPRIKSDADCPSSF
jgi:hypothetical protein